MWFKIILLLCAFNGLFGAIKDHLKPINNKTPCRGFKNIDYIYLINLDERPEKYKHCLRELLPYGIKPYRFSAVNGWTLPLKTILDVGVKFRPGMKGHMMATTYNEEGYHHESIEEFGKTYFGHCLSKGSIGIALSHLSILQDAYHSNYKTILVLEDDIEIQRAPYILDEYIEKLDELVGETEWDILFTDQDTKDSNGNYVPCTAYAPRLGYFPFDPNRCLQRKDISEDFRKVGARYGAYSMIVRRSGMKKLLDYFNEFHIYLPFDMEYTLPHDIHLFCLRDDVISTLPKALSDNGAPNYQNNGD